MGRPNTLRNSKNGFATLEHQIKHISDKTIRKKWKKLPLSSHDAAQVLILSAKEQSGQRQRGRAGIYQPTEDCVQEVTNKLIQRLPRIPFPPRTDDSHFDLEANLHRMRKIEEQLTSNIHSMKLLRAQISKEEKQLKQEEAELEYLEKSLQSNERYRRQQSRTIHPSARTLVDDTNDLDLLALESKDKTDPESLINAIMKDENMRPILQLLQNHLDNMDNNIPDIKRVTRAVEVTGFQLQHFAKTNMRQRQHGRVFGEITADQTRS